MYGRVVELPRGSSTPTVLPFSGLYQPQGLAVDNAGAVYVADFNNRVLMLAAGSTAQTVLPFAGVAVPWGIAVDNAGDLFVTEHDSNQVLKLTAGSNTPTVLPLNGLNTPLGVAVDSAGNIYVADRGNDRTVKLAAWCARVLRSRCGEKHVVVRARGRRGIGGHGVEAGVARRGADHRDGVITAADL
jgi:serine/threonine protein kinase, bacterial